MPLPANVSTVDITGAFTDADGSAAVGEVYIDAVPDYVLDASAAPPTTIGLDRYRFVLDATGEIPVGSEIIATDDADLNPTGWTYKVVVNLRSSGKRIEWFMTAPAAASPIDLTLAAPVDSDMGVPTVVGPTGPPGGTMPEATEAEAQAGTSSTTAMTPRRVADALTSLTLPRFDPRLSVYNWKPSNTVKLRAALSKSLTSHTTVAMVGDSITAGRLPGSGLLPTGAFSERLLNLMIARGYTEGGDDWVGVMNYTVVDANIDPRWVLSGVWSLANGFGVLTTAAGATATFTSIRTGTIVNVYYFNNNTPAFTVAIDGGAPVTVTPVAGQTLGTYTVTGLADTTHTVVVARVAGTMQFIGAGVTKTTGLSIIKMGIGGFSSTEWNSTAWYLHRAQVLQVAPSAIFLMLGTNDQIEGVTVPTYITNMTALITSFQTVGNVVVMMPCSAADLSAYRTALYGLADTFDIPLIDWEHHFNGYTAANAAGLFFDSFHPNAAGHFEMAAMLANIVSS